MTGDKILSPSLSAGNLSHGRASWDVQRTRQRGTDGPDSLFKCLQSPSAIGRKLPEPCLICGWIYKSSLRWVWTSHLKLDLDPIRKQRASESKSVDRSLWGRTDRDSWHPPVL